MVVATKIGFRSRLCDEKVLTPLTSVVLNINHLVRFAIKMLVCVICFLQVVKSVKGKEKESQKGFY